ncbi:MAG TPA: formylglycine-generating enzyme family protein [Lentisphaeria bacterium]|nr:formylglycine-generating enzyme family protein [Lentisphaeria bacterium]
MPNITRSTAIRSGHSFTYKLSVGWNLISINLNLDQESKDLLVNKGAMALDASSKAYSPSGNLAVPLACWIYCQAADEITLSGAAVESFDFEASLKKGWNFVGPLYDRSLERAGAAAWGWNGRSFYPTTSLRAGQGYWLYWPDDYVAPPENTYLIVDLSAGPEAASYPVSYRSSPPTYGWTDEYKTTKLVLRKIPAGSFIMGSLSMWSPGGELGNFADNETQHQVTLTQDFYVGVFEVTQKQWNLVMGDWPSYFSNPDYRDARPVEQVSYDDIRGEYAGARWPSKSTVDVNSFLGRLRARAGLDFDLPTEAQWEYACRAGTTTALNSGKNLTHTNNCPNMDEVGRYWWNGGQGGYLDDGITYDPTCDTTHGTAKVGSYLPNRWGLYDMHGNADEWCLDWYQEDLGSSAQTDPKGAASGSDRVFRSGRWGNNAHYCRSASRNSIWPNIQVQYYGFRLVRTLP